MLEAYDTDFTVWASCTADLLRAKRWNEVDWEHLIVEVEDLGKNERSTIGSQMERIILQLLLKQL